MFSLRPILSLALCSALPACTAIPATNVAPSPISAGQPSVSSALLPPYKAQVQGTVTSIEPAPYEPPVDCSKLPPRPIPTVTCQKALQIVTIDPDPDSGYTVGRFATMATTKFYLQQPDGLHPATIADVKIGSRVRAWWEDSGAEVEWIGGGGLALVILPPR